MRAERTRLLALIDDLSRNPRFRQAIGGTTLLVSAGILGSIIVRQWETLITYEWQFRWWALLASFLLFSIDLLLASLVWASIMKSMGNSLSLERHLRYYVVAHAARRLPGRIWYVASRAILYKRDGVALSSTSLASAYELGILATSGLIASLAFGLPIVAKYQLGYISLAALVVFFGLAIQPRVANLLLARIGAEGRFESNYTKLGTWVTTYLLVWLLGGVALFAAGNVVTNIGIEYLPYVVGSWSVVGVLSTALFFLPTGLGLTEVGLSFLLTSIVPIPVAVVIAITARILFTAYEILWAALSFRL